MVHVFVMLQWHWSVQSLSKIRRNDNKFLFNKAKKIKHRNIIKDAFRQPILYIPGWLSSAMCNISILAVSLTSVISNMYMLLLSTSY